MKLYMVLLGLILLSFPVVAGPYCINGSIGDLDVEITEISNTQNGQCVDLIGCEIKYEIYHAGNYNIDARVQWELVNLNNNLTILNGSNRRGVDANWTEHGNFDLDLTPGLNESEDYLVIVKAYHVDGSWENETSFETTNCAEDSEEIDIVNYRKIDFTNVSITPSNLDCDTKEFTVTTTIENNFADIEYISLKIRDGSDMLGLEYNSANFSLANGESKTISHTFDLPGFHLYKHLFAVSPESTNIHDWEGKSYEYLTIDKCSTDNAQNLQEGVPKLVNQLQRIEKLFTKLCTFLSNQGYNC